MAIGTVLSRSPELTDTTISAAQTGAVLYVKLDAILQSPHDWKCTETAARQLGFAVYTQPQINFGVD
jgi:hypothetical protein